MKIKPSNERLKYALAKIRVGERIYTPCCGEATDPIIRAVFAASILVTPMLAVMTMFSDGNGLSLKYSILFGTCLAIILFFVTLFLARRACTHSEYRAIYEYKFKKSCEKWEPMLEKIEKTFPRQDAFIKEFEDTHRVSC